LPASSDVAPVEASSMVSTFSYEFAFVLDETLDQSP
jgi:hypothetical protein